MAAVHQTLSDDGKSNSETEIRSPLPIDPGRTQPTDRDATGEYLYLVGRPTLKQFLQVVRSCAVNPPGEGELADEWRAAHGRLRVLEEEEAGLADNPSFRKLGDEYDPLLIEFLKDPLVRHGFNTVPTDVVMVELDRLVVYQKHIDLTFVRQLKKQLGPAPGAEAIFRACLLHDQPRPPVKWSRGRGESFVFLSPSNDLRFLGAMPLTSAHLKDCPPAGDIAGVVGIAVGFGSNFLNAVFAEHRLILNNGSHRAFALRELGVTHAPCIVQHVSSRDELEVIAAARLRERPDPYLRHPRPSLLKDYFDPTLRKIIPVHRRLRQVTVNFKVDESYVPSF
jgi:hypothetical protein